MEEPQQGVLEQRTDDQVQEDRSSDEQQRRPEDLDPKDRGKDIKGGAGRYNF